MSKHLLAQAAVRQRDATLRCAQAQAEAALEAEPSLAQRNKRKEDTPQKKANGQGDRHRKIGFASFRPEALCSIGNAWSWSHGHKFKETA